MHKKNSTIDIISTIVTVGVLGIMTATFMSQKGFNEKQIEFNRRLLNLTEASAVPQVFAVLDSLTALIPEADHNVYYTIKNVGKTPAFDLRSVCKFTRLKINPIENELDVGIAADLFPMQTKQYPSKRTIKLEGTEDTLYFHVRVDYNDMLNRRYCYRATYCLLCKLNKSTDIWKFNAKMESSEFKSLEKK